MKKNEPENFARISKIMLPKDYINYKLTGVHSCDYSDASGMLLLDVRNKRWSKEMLDICSVREDQMPKLFESYEVIGPLKPEIATALKLSPDVRVVAGAGDNAAAAVGTGTVGEGNCNISIGTSGTVFVSSDRFNDAEGNALHSFAHADGGYHLMGCMLSAASCNKWFCDEILKEDDYDSVQSEIDRSRLGENPVFFLPYLMGERSPINDTDARGVFLGMSMNTTRGDMIQAVLEGVAFAIKDNIEAAKTAGVLIERSKICGGGAKSKLWRTIFSSVLNIPLDIPVTEEGPSYGGAMLAMVGTGLFPDIKTCADALTRVKETVMPDPGLAEKYTARYEEYRRIYPSLRTLFRSMRKQ
jgi:xylulokinase